MNSQIKISKYFLTFAVAFCILALGICCMSVKHNQSYAEDVGTVPTYFRATDGTNNYQRGSTVFLDIGQSLNISLAKPLVVSDDYIGENKSYTDQTLIGNYALDFLNLSPTLSINGARISNLDDYYKIVSYEYIVPVTLTQKTFSYFELNIDLAEKTAGGTQKFPSGEYVLTFNAYNEYSGTDFANSTTNLSGFSVTFYVFSTSEYFTDDNAIKQKTDFENVLTSTPMGSMYRNYYFFNYTNYTKTTTDANYVPSLTFDAKKFSVNITKSLSGIQKTCTVNNFVSNTNLIQLTGNTTDEFVTAKYNSDGTITIYFYDLGDYKISYDFYFTTNNSEHIKLQNNDIAVFQEKSDILYVYGYQMFISGTSLVDDRNEFKLLDQNGATAEINSADVSYRLSYSELLLADEVNYEQNNGFLTEILTKTPASTNQPAITTATNATIIQEKSYFYTLDQTTNDFAKENGQYVTTSYKDDAFTSAGTYLLKVVYFFNNYNNSTYFTQYFYFKINNSTPSLVVEEILDDNTTNVLGVNSFTKNAVRITLEQQSVFNSPVRFVLWGKSFGTSGYNTTITTQNGQVGQDVVFEILKSSLNYNRNYKLDLIYGINDKNKTSTYFTIDDTAFEQNEIKILPAIQSSSTSLYYSKDTANPVEFFTNQNVVVEWKEKTSGAKSSAYYKYIPFTKITTSATYSTYNSDNAIATNYALDLDSNQILTMGGYNNTKNMSQIKSDAVFDNQGFYIIYLVDQAGNEEYISFCIDRTEITVWQIVDSNYQTGINKNNNIVSSDATLQWGRYKLISLGVNTLDVADPWVNYVFEELTALGDADNDGEYSDDTNIMVINDSYFFAVEISKTYVLQSGLDTQIVSDARKSSDIIVFVEKDDYSGYEFAKELTYIYYFIDESNALFDNAQNSSVSKEQIIQNSSLAYKITTSSDSANANILINNSATDDLTQISASSASLSIAGFTDSSTNLSTDVPDLRSKYYFATGDTKTQNVSLLTYVYQKNEATSAEVASVEVIYYPFELNNGVYVLSDTAITLFHTETALSGDYLDYYAFNINPEYDASSGTYKTKEGKYIVIRTYASSAGVQEYDFFTRENIVIVDRQDIVSNPQEIDGVYKSYVGGDIFVNLLDGYDQIDGMVKFDSIYSAKNNQTYVLQTNKLPVVVYVPITKYGSLTSDGDYFIWTANHTLGKFFNFSQDANNLSVYYLERFNTDNGSTRSKLLLSYFGDNNILTNHFENSDTYRNPSFDLTINITDNKGRTITSQLNQNNASNYWVSNDITSAGIYTVEIIQNATYGSVYPNIYKTFKFTFEVIERPPVFDFVSTKNDNVFNSDENGVYYTNENSFKVKWSDPTSDYLAEIDKNNIYYTINNIRTNVKFSDILTTDNKNYSFVISGLKNQDVVTVHMQYIGQQSEYSYLNKKLVVDLEAPSTVIDALIAANMLSSDSNFVAQTRLIADTYNITNFTGYLAYYSFVVNKNDITNLLASKPSVNGYFVDGHDYYIKLITNIDNYEISSIQEALNKVNAIYTEYNAIRPAGMNAGQYYEVLELDLAGNCTIYTLQVVSPSAYEVVIEFEKESTEYNDDFVLTYAELSANSPIFAKGKFLAKTLNLYDNNWLTFKVNNTTYFKAPSLKDGEFYNFTSWTNLSLQPQIATLDQILNFENAGTQTLTINNPAFSQNHQINICITKSELASTLLTVDEGIRILGTATQYPVSMKIYSYQNNKYELIYDQTNFVSTQEITYSRSGNTYQFKVNNPLNAYKYEFVDNFGIAYVDYHTIGVEKLPEDEIVQDYVCKQEITEDNQTQTWFVGFDTITYNYNASEYDAYIKIYYLEFNTLLNTLDWREYNYPDGIIDSTYGCTLVSGISNQFFKVSSTKTINHIEILPQKEILNLENYSGNAVKAIITLKNQKDFSSTDAISEYLLVNNITPNIKLTDNNGQDKSALLDGNSLYSGQITVFYQTSVFENEFVFPHTFGLIYNNSAEKPLESGQRIADAGTYIINIYAMIGGQKHLIKSHTILIEPSEDFYNVVVFDEKTQMYVSIAPTGNIFEDKNTGIVSYKHYIVTTEQYKINVSENDEILDPMNPANASTCIVATINSANNTYYTIIYLITNEQSESPDIRPCKFSIAVTYIPPSNSLFESIFGYDIDSDGQLINLTGATEKVAISDSDQNFVALTISYNSYYLIEENKITPTIYYGENLDTLYNPKITDKNGVSTFTLEFNGLYTLIFKDVAGNTHLFTDGSTGLKVNSFRFIYVNGVAFEINGKAPIENAYYNDKVEITLPEYLNEIYSYDIGGSPKIKVTKNGKSFEDVNFDKSTGVYTITGAGYYSVYFEAMINGKTTHNLTYNFNIIASKEYKTDFNFAEYGDYEIISVKKNGVSVDYSNLFPHDEETKYLKSLNLSINDEMTGEGSYEITVATNSGLQSVALDGTYDECFTFNLMIKYIGYVPLQISLDEGESTTKKITVRFNASDVFNSVGECKIICGTTVYNITEQYVNDLKNNGSSYQTCEITENGTHFVQVYSSSGKLLFSYKVVKVEPLNTVSIILIVVGVLATTALIITITLLRKRMKIK